MAEVAGGSRLAVIALEQLQPMQILEAIDTEAILASRMQNLVAYWRANDPPAGAVYDVENLEFDPLKINQELAVYFELMLRDRVNQAARAVTLAFGSSTDLDAIASRYPGGVPRLTGESDDRYRRRIWLSANALSPHGIYETYVFWALTSDVTLKDATATTVPGSGTVKITIMATDAAPVPSQTQINATYAYIMDKARKGLTDVIQVAPPVITTIDYVIRYWLLPGYDKDAVETELYTALNAFIAKSRWLGTDHMRIAIDAALARNGVYDAKIDSPAKDVKVDANGLVNVRSVTLRYVGRGE